MAGSDFVSNGIPAAVAHRSWQDRDAVQAAAREALALVENNVAGDKPQAEEGGRRLDSSWKGDTEGDTVAVHKGAAVRTVTVAVVQAVGTGHTQSAAAAGVGNSRNMLVAAVGKRPEDKPGLTAAAEVHREGRPVVAADRIWLW